MSYMRGSVAFLIIATTFAGGANIGKDLEQVVASKQLGWEFVQACQKGDIERVRQLLSVDRRLATMPIISKNDLVDCETPVEAAIRGGHTNILQVLLETASQYPKSSEDAWKHMPIVLLREDRLTRYTMPCWSTALDTKATEGTILVLIRNGMSEWSAGSIYTVSRLGYTNALQEMAEHAKIRDVGLDKQGWLAINLLGEGRLQVVDLLMRMNLITSNAITASVIGKVEERARERRDPTIMAKVAEWLRPYRQ